MLPVTIRRVFVAQHRVDFRKGPDGLLGEAYLLGADPYQGDCVLFVSMWNSPSGGMYCTAG